MESRFSTNQMFAHIAPRERSKLYYDESAKLLDIRETSITTIQACVLLGGISTTEDNAMTESIYYTVACRMANLLDLPHRQTSTPLEKEINIRSEFRPPTPPLPLNQKFKLNELLLVWWSLCMVDVWSSKSVRLPRQMPHLPDLALPIDEAIFLQTPPSKVPNQNPHASSLTPLTTNPDRSTSLVAQMILLNRILMQINDVITEAASSTTSPNLIISHKITDLSQKLHDWHHSLPSNMLDTPGNLNRYAAQGLGRIFVAVYLGYYHFGQVLLYQFLHEDRGTEGGDRDSRAAECKEFAANLCSLVYRAHATPGCEVWYNSKPSSSPLHLPLIHHLLPHSPKPNLAHLSPTKKWSDTSS